MGNYNPNNPTVLGMEWVPLADRMRTLDIGTEIGYGFTVTGAPFDTLNTAVLLTLPPTQALAGSTILYNVYPRGREDDTGEINVTRLTTDNVFVSGAATIGGGTATNALSLAGDATYLQFDSTADQIRGRFTIPVFLQGKRILRVDLVFNTFGTPGYALYPTIETVTVAYPYGTFTGPASLAEAREQTLSFGEVNPWWAILGGVGPNTNSSRFPWRWDELSRLSSGELAIGIKVDHLPLSGVANLSYLGMDIYYCEESRVRYGGQAIGQDPTGNLSLTLPSTSYQIPLRTTAYATSGTMAPGDYTITVTQADAGDRYNTSGIALPELTQFREIRTHPGVLVEKFKPGADPLPIIPPVSSRTDQMVAVAMSDGSNILQAGEAPFTYVDLYGAPVYIGSTGTSFTVVQQIHNEARVLDPTYEWVRFYARRINPSGPGNLTVSVGGSGSATITAEDFAALDELTLGDSGTGTGWKEVTLPISATFSSDATFRNVTFTMTGVATGSPIDQYQLATSGAALPTQFVNLTGYPNSIYDGLQNASATMKTPNSTSPISTQSYTTTVMFGQAAPAVTGFAVTGSGCAIELEGIGTGCTDNVCVPTHILGNRIGWRFALHDEFTRNNVDSWDGATSGQTYTLNGGTNPGNYDVNGSRGTITNDSVNVSRQAWALMGSPDFDMYVDATVPVLPTGAGITQSATGRVTDASNMFFGNLLIGTTGTVTVNISRIVGGAGAVFGASTSIPGLHTAGDTWKIRFRGVGTVFSMKAWNVTAGATEPPSWQLTATDTSGLLTGDSNGVRSRLETGNTNGTVITSYDNLCATPVGYLDGTIEIQRTDSTASGVTTKALDTFSRVVVSGWGSSETLPAGCDDAVSSFVWTQEGTASSSVNGSRALHTYNAANVVHQALVDTGDRDMTLVAQYLMPFVPTGNAIRYTMAGRVTDINTRVIAQLEVGTTGVATLNIRKFVASVNTISSVSFNAGSVSAGETWQIKLDLQGSTYRAKAWSSIAEPADWQVTLGDPDTSTVPGTLAGPGSFPLSGLTNPTPFSVQYDNFQITTADVAADDWQTIARLDTCTSSFCDFEARTCVQTMYRMRVLDNSGFAGPWSSTVPVTLASPAVSGVGDGNSVLIFTSNQDTSKSLAYVMQFSGEPIEEFTFPEAGFTQLRAQYQRDFFSAFRPTERGGETFTRDILVQAAAIPPVSLANFRSLRDLAWDNLPYICVRDELGNRWYANVLVPAGRVRRDRTVYIAQVQITEVTDTAAPVEG